MSWIFTFEGQKAQIVELRRKRCLWRGQEPEAARKLYLTKNIRFYQERLLLREEANFVSAFRFYLYNCIWYGWFGRSILRTRIRRVWCSMLMLLPICRHRDNPNSPFLFPFCCFWLSSLYQSPKTTYYLLVQLISYLVFINKVLSLNFMNKENEF